MQNVVVIDMPRRYADRVLGARPVIKETPTTITVDMSGRTPGEYTITFDKRTGAAKGKDRARSRFMTADEYIMSDMMITGRQR
jgi:hypothetical protein